MDELHTSDGEDDQEQEYEDQTQTKDNPGVVYRAEETTSDMWDDTALRRAFGDAFGKHKSQKEKASPHKKKQQNVANNVPPTESTATQPQAQPYQGAYQAPVWGATAPPSFNYPQYNQVSFSMQNSCFNH